jgi:S1-C subfamily serine protease
MNILDLTIILLVLASVFRGWQAGLIRQAVGLVGFWAGLFVGALLAARIADNIIPAWRVSVVLVSLGIFTFAGLVVGDMVGRLVAGLARRLHIGPLDSFLGGLLGAATTLFGVWALAAIISLLPFPSLSRLVRQSAIARALADSLPPTPEVIAKVEQSLVPTIYPRVFAGLAPAPAAPVGAASSAEVQQAVAADQDGVVKVQGLACDSVDEGSGFIVAPDMVVTNAHVIAGVSEPVVYDRNGSHSAVPVLFDPNTDLALLRVDGLSGKPLPLDEDEIDRGTKAAALGYPEGGPFSATAAGILREILAEGQNIYGTGDTSRHVYELQSDIQPGNSGGPLALPDGRVIGIVFARSDSDQGVGYALTMGQVGDEITGSLGATQPVGTGQCISG